MTRFSQALFAVVVAVLVAAMTIRERRGLRYGLIAGATGTGKTVTLQVLAEAFVREGVNVFASDCSVAGEEAPADDVLAVAGGHPALSLVPPEEPAG